MSTPICKVWDAEQGKYVGIPAIKGTDGKTPVRGTNGGYKNGLQSSHEK